MAGAAAASRCIFCQIAGKSSSTTLLHTDEKVVAFQDIKPAAIRHYLVIPVDHIPTVNDLRRRPEDYSLVSHMLEVGKTLIQRDAPQSHQYRHEDQETTANKQKSKNIVKILQKLYAAMLVSMDPFTSSRNELVKNVKVHKLISFVTGLTFGFHQPPFNSVHHLHLHCFALPYTPRWKHIKYLSVGSFGFIEAEKLLEKIKPLPSQM